MKNEGMEKAGHDSKFLCDDLREALLDAKNVESIIILDLIQRANELRRDIESLNIAMQGDEEVDHA